jgi:hypothetical protein
MDGGCLKSVGPVAIFFMNEWYTSLEHSLQALQTQFFVNLKSQFNKKAQKSHFSSSPF